MSTDVNLLGKGLKKLAILLFLFILSPVLLTMSFKGLKAYTESPELLFAYGFLIISILLVIYTIYFAFKTFQVLLNSLFTKE
jgi:hypothetical protein